MRIFFAALVVLLSFGIAPAMGSSDYLPEGELKKEAQTALDRILDLWRDGRFRELYDLSVGDRNTLEGFTRRLSSAPLKPSCCWEKLQEVSVRLQGDSKAVVRGRFGLDGQGGTRYKTTSVRLEKEDGAWRVSRGDLLSMAEAAKKKKGRRIYR